MANRRSEERERLRALREEREAQRSSDVRRRLTIVYAAAGALALIGAAVVVVLLASSSGGGAGRDSGGAHISYETGSTNSVKPDEREGITPPAVTVSSLQAAARDAGCQLRLHLRDEGHTHIPPTAPTPHYGSNPPTSGTHVEPPYQQADGAYAAMPREIFFLHSLEHGRVEIQYSPKLPETDQLALKGVYDTMYGGTLLFPNTNMPYAVAATAWTNLMGCSSYRGAITLDAVRDFAKATWGRYGGESPSAFKIIGPTPRQAG